MHAFKDTADRVWSVAINVSTIRRVRALVGVDLYGLIDDGFQPLAALVSDPVRLADVLYCLCKDEADARGVSDEEFGRALAGDAILRATDCLVDELVSFFPDPRARASLARVVEAGRTVKAKLLDHAEAELDRLDTAEAARTWIASRGNSPVPSASTPARSPSANSS